MFGDSRGGSGSARITFNDNHSTKQTQSLKKRKEKPVPSRVRTPVCCGRQTDKFTCIFDLHSSFLIFLSLKTWNFYFKFWFIKVAFSYHHRGLFSVRKRSFRKQIVRWGNYNRILRLVYRCNSKISIGAINSLFCGVTAKLLGRNGSCDKWYHFIWECYVNIYYIKSKETVPMLICIFVIAKSTDKTY